MTRIIFSSNFLHLNCKSTYQQAKDESKYNRYTEVGTNTALQIHISEGYKGYKKSLFSKTAVIGHRGKCTALT